MTTSEIDYPALVDDALRGVARAILERVAREGLPGEHHFFLTFDTGHADLEMPPSLRAAYPEEMTIVLQNQFWDLEVDSQAFEVSLRFGGEPQRLRVPWQAMRSFVDPAAEFGLRFGSATEEVETAESEPERPASGESGEVISLDEFRRRDP